MDVDPDVAIWSSEAATALGAMRSVVPGDRPYVSVVGDSAAAILAGELDPSAAESCLLCQRESTLKEGERRGIRTRLLSEVGQHGDQDVLVLLDGALEVPSFVQLLAVLRGRLVPRRPPRISADFSSLFRTATDRVAIRSFARLFWFDALIKGTLRADGLAERVLALDEVSQWWQQPRARTLVRIGANRVVRDSQRQTRWLSTLAAIRVVAPPVLLQQFLQAMVGMVDKMLAGRLPENQVLVALDAIGIGSFVGWFIGIAMAALGVGGSAIIARPSGRSGG